MIPFFFLVGILFSSQMALAIGAPKITSNPTDVAAIADFPEAGYHDIMGHVLFRSPHGEKVDIHVDVTKLPSTGGPFVYHIHENPVPEGGDCEGVGAHFNPYGASPDCDSQESHDYCQIGDLSGKYGFIDTTCFQADYCDPYISLNHSAKAGIIGRSIVFHNADLSKFACATIRYATPEQLKAIEQEIEKDKENEKRELVEVENVVGATASGKHGAEVMATSNSSSAPTSAYTTPRASSEVYAKSIQLDKSITTGQNYTNNSVNWSSVHQLGSSFSSGEGARSSIAAYLGTVASIITGLILW